MSDLITEVQYLLQSSYLSTGFGFIISLLMFVVWRIVRKIFKKLVITQINTESMDYALEKSIGNGYSEHRKEKKKELMEQEKFIEADTGKFKFFL